MARDGETIGFLEGRSAALAELLRLALSLTPQSQGQIVAQREIVAALENAMDARRERIDLSQSTVNWVKWSCMFAQAVCALVAIAMVHSDNRAAAAIAIGIFATGVAVSALLIASHDRPFSRRDFCQTRCASASQAGVIWRWIALICDFSREFLIFPSSFLLG